MKRTLPIIVVTIACLSSIGVVTVHAAQAPAWIRNSAGRIEKAGIPIQALTAPLRQEGGYLGQCANFIEQQAAYCSQYENWHLDIQVLRTSTRAPKKTIKIQDIRNGPTNKCRGTRAGNMYPLHIKSISLGAQWAGAQSEDQVLCTVTCSGWTCAPEETQSEQSFTCKSGTQKTDDCMHTCDFRHNSCRADPDQFDCSICTPIEQSSPPAPVPTPSKECGLGQCKFDVYCNAFGQGGCWYCDCSVCSPDASIYQTCR